jgi:hypothetical protein
MHLSYPPYAPRTWYTMHCVNNVKSTPRYVF